MTDSEDVEDRTDKKDELLDFAIEYKIKGSYPDDTSKDQKELSENELKI